MTATGASAPCPTERKSPRGESGGEAGPLPRFFREHHPPCAAERNHGARDGLPGGAAVFPGKSLSPHPLQRWMGATARFRCTWVWSCFPSLRQKGTWLPHRFSTGGTGSAPPCGHLQNCAAWGRRILWRRGKGGGAAGEVPAGSRAFLYLKGTIFLQESQAALCRFYIFHQSGPGKRAPCTKVRPWKRFLPDACGAGKGAAGEAPGERERAARRAARFEWVMRRPGAAPPGSGGGGHRRGSGSVPPSPGRPPRCPSCRRACQAATSWGRAASAAG